MWELIMKFAAIIAASALALSTSAYAGGFTENFDAENGGETALNYTGFTNFIVPAGFNVDLVKSGDWGITCSGSCVDLDGSAGPGALQSNIFDYLAGDLIKLSFDFGGSQRILGGLDELFVEIATSSEGNFATGFVVPSEAEFFNFSYSFVAVSAGTVQFALSTTSKNRIGPLIDNVSLSISAVPEPTSWAMMIGGFALAGAAMRRRRTSVSFA
jgi:hypothetical protein